MYRVFHEEKREYTWSRRNPVRKQARLDFFLTSFDCFLYTSDTCIIPGYRSDHSGILLDLTLNENERGRGYWKFNNSLLKDQNYIKLVKDTLFTLFTNTVFQEGGLFWGDRGSMGGDRWMRVLCALFCVRRSVFFWGGAAGCREWPRGLVTFPLCGRRVFLISIISYVY